MDSDCISLRTSLCLEQKSHFSPKVEKSDFERRKSDLEQKIEKKDKWRPNLRLRACLAMCLKYGKSQPKRAYKARAYKKKECNACETF